MASSRPGIESADFLLGSLLASPGAQRIVWGGLGFWGGRGKNGLLPSLECWGLELLLASAYVPKESVKDMDESAENPSQTECKYYLRSGGCKHGENCRYSHSKGKLELNFLGLPIRPGKRECPYYMQNGSCKYASNCRFNHPDPTATGGSDPPSGYGNGGPASLQGESQSTVAPWSAPRPLNEDPVYSTLMIPPPQVVSSQNSEWNGYQASAYAPERSMPARPPYMMNNSVAETNVYRQHPHQNQVEEFPERPGQPLCSYFLRKGVCKFKSKCKYHHPKTHRSRPPNRTQ